MSAVQRPRVAAPAVQHLGGAVLIQGRAVRALAYSVNRAVEVAQREGQRRENIDRLLDIRRAALQANDFQMSRSGHGDVADSPDLGQLNAGERDWISIDDAAIVAKRSRRQVQRIAHTLATARGGGARRVGNAWAIDRAALSAYLLERDERLEVPE